jgi:hypothetical protein
MVILFGCTCGSPNPYQHSANCNTSSDSYPFHLIDVAEQQQDQSQQRPAPPDRRLGE